jgi:hypothetical protein
LVSFGGEKENDSVVLAHLLQCLSINYATRLARVGGKDLLLFQLEATKATSTKRFLLRFTKYRAPLLHVDSIIFISHSSYRNSQLRHFVFVMIEVSLAMIKSLLIKTKFFNGKIDSIQIR